MKKSLLSLLAIALAAVGCQNYDDQFDDLNSQIAALSSQVAGLAQVQSDLASLAGTVSSLQSTVASTATAIEGLDGLAENVAAIQESVNETSSSEDLGPTDAEASDLTDLILSDSSFLEIHDNTAWKMIEGTFTEYTLFYNSEESFIKVYDFSCDDSLQSNNLGDLDTSLIVDLNSNTVIYEYFADGEYMVRTEDIYRDTLYRVEITADALWSELGCD